MQNIFLKEKYMTHFKTTTENKRPVVLSYFGVISNLCYAWTESLSEHKYRSLISIIDRMEKSNAREKSVHQQIVGKLKTKM
jgi:hypothetical protein